MALFARASNCSTVGAFPTLFIMRLRFATMHSAAVDSFLLSYAERGIGADRLLRTPPLEDVRFTLTAKTTM
jgi:hypothetical protein